MCLGLIIFLFWQYILTWSIANQSLYITFFFTVNQIDALYTFHVLEAIIQALFPCYCTSPAFLYKVFLFSSIGSVIYFSWSRVQQMSIFWQYHSIFPDDIQCCCIQLHSALTIWSRTSLLFSSIHHTYIVNIQILARDSYWCNASQNSTVEWLSKTN